MRHGTMSGMRGALILFGTLLAGTVLPSTVARLNADESTDTDLPKYHEYERRIGQLIHAEATAKSPAARAQSIQDMAALFTKIRRDPRLETSDTLRSYRTKLWGRLMLIKKDLEREIARRERAAKRSTPTAVASAEDPAFDFATQHVVATLDLTAISLGGAGRLFSAGGFAYAAEDDDGEKPAGAAGGGTGDYGPALVNLIQRTVYPDFWDVHGGPGTIVYYAPLRCLVVRATGGVHSTVRGFIGGLRDK